MKEASLTPCPFCGSKDIGYHFIARRGCGVMVKCKECGSSSGIFWMTKENGYHDGAELKAAEAWNRRYKSTCHASDIYDNVFECSECGCMDTDGMPNYCPNCGAKVVVND